MTDLERLGSTQEYQEAIAAGSLDLEPFDPSERERMMG